MMQKRQFLAKTCLHCKSTYVPTGCCQKYCENCKREMDLQRMRNRHYATYVRKGYNQRGENNNRLKAGTGTGRKTWVYEKERKDYCEYCGARVPEVPRLVVHHLDGDATNDHPSNHITLCDSCHKLVHSGKITLTKGIVREAK